MADVEKQVKTTFTVVDNASANVKQLAQLMSGLGKSTAQAKRMLKTYGTAQTQMGQRVTAASKRIAAANVHINKSATAMRNAAKAANIARKATKISTAAKRKATQATRELSKSTVGLRGTFLLAAAAATAFFAVMQGRSIIKLGKEFEDTQLAIAGTIQALGFTPDFPKALETTAAAMEKIRVKAALLPGEVKDYVQVFRIGVAGMRGAVGGTLNDMIEFSAKFTAVTQTMQIDSAQAARDLSLMLSATGRAGTEVKSFVNLLEIMKDLPGHANLTAKTFNKLTQKARGDLLAKTFEKYDDAIKHSQKTLDAQAGAFKSNIQLAKRLGGAALYTGLVKSLTFMNDALMTTEGQLTPLMLKIIGVGEAISKGIVAGLEAAVSAAKSLYDWTNKAIGVMAGVGGSMAKAAESAMGSAGKAMAGGGVASAVGVAAGAGAMALGAGGPAGIAIAALIDFSSRTEAVGVVLGELSRFGEMLMVPFSALGNAAMMISTVLADVLEGALGGFISMVTDIAGPVLGILSAGLNLAAESFNMLRPTLMNLWKSVGMLFTSIGKFLNPIIRIVGVAFIGIYKIARFFLMPIFDALVTAVAAITTVLSLFIDAIAGWLGSVADAAESATGVSVRTGGIAGLSQKNANKDFISEYFDKFKSKHKPASEELLGATAKAPKGRGGGGRTVNDFRYSRFQIDQKFAEGFDPDRIAVAFAQDLGKVGEQKLQSGFEPLFSLS